MKKNIYIINNGLKDLRGHYFETAVSIAEASRALGLRPVLAAHVTCPSDIIPDGLDFHPVFTTDHWVCQPPLPQPELRDLRGELAPLRANSIVAGWTESEMTESVLTWDKFVANNLPRVPVRRWGTRQDFAAIAVYLASPASRYHTGDIVTIDGGYSIF